MPNAGAPVNIIHQNDCIELIYQIIKQQVWGETFNACADKHPLRKDYYREAAVLIGLESPEFTNQEACSYKLINSDKIKKRLGYTFKYPDPMEMLKEVS